MGANPLSDVRIVTEMCDQIVHRGPDDQGVYVTARAQIGMRRLSIIDLESGHQPIHNEDKSIWIVFNGEIYNFKELRRELERCGHVFYTNTDTECIVHAYEQYGYECFSKLRGMFTVAILDHRHDRLILARDRIGKKPLYYTSTDSGHLAFGSELKCLFRAPGFKPVVSAQSTRQYFALGYVPGPGSIYENVQKLAPAHYLVMEKGTIDVRRYWSLAFGPKWKDDEATLRERLLGQLDEAVRLRLVSDVPFGVFLSGGLDSSVVAALMARHMSTPVKAFTIGFSADAFNELPDARLVAQHIGAEHHELVVTPDAVGMLSDLAWHFDEPFGDSSSIPTFAVAKLAAAHVKMVLSGDGGDEGFAGYERYFKYMKLNALAAGTLGLAQPAVRLAAGIVGGRVGSRMWRVADRMALAYPDRYLSGVAVSTASDVGPILSPDLTGIDPFATVRGHFQRLDIEDPMDKILAGDMDTYLVDDIMVKVDRMTMANSLEARAPLLDHVLLEFAARLPFPMKYNGRQGKYLLRQAAQSLLPAACLQKRKQGFGIPLAAWFRREFKPLMLDMLADRRFAERGVFNAAGIKACFDAHLSGQHDFSELLWLVLTYEMWARNFVDGRNA
ncbi:MAG: asparagine synthase (glutamine-hydrolyzing) [Ramlibacter sp.]|nr:asparagine synthase (glutamine-hydrolyzing) [Ramlibacter sp.]